MKRWKYFATKWTLAAENEKWNKRKRRVAGQAPTQRIVQSKRIWGRISIRTHKLMHDSVKTPTFVRKEKPLYLFDLFLVFVSLFTKGDVSIDPRRTTETLRGLGGVSEPKLYKDPTS